MKRLAEKGCFAVTMSDNPTKRGLPSIHSDHWEPLLRARAIENQCFVLAAGQFGFHGGKRTSWGKTQIVDPWGTPLAMVPEREGMALAVLDAADQDRMRRDLPCLLNRRLT